MNENAGGCMLSRRTIVGIGALMAGMAIVGVPLTPASAQVSPPSRVKADTSKKGVAADTSIKRIKITKDTIVRQAGGEVCLPNACVTPEISTVTQMTIELEKYARDAQRRLDSMQADARLQVEIARIENRYYAQRSRAWLDSIARATAETASARLAMKRHLARGFYIGLAAGSSVPQRNLRNDYAGGWNTTLPVGWDADHSPLGFRSDLAFDQLNGTVVRDASNTTLAVSRDISVWSLNADVKLRARAPGTPSRTHVYVLGGIGAHRVASGVYGTTGPDAGKDLKVSDAKTKFGWNVGAGLSTEWGPAEVFIESRFFQIKTDMAYHMNGGVGNYTAFMPIVFGLQWF
jgi:opacity protein-like surface antigen